MIDWSKTICPDFDRIDMRANRYDDWFHIEMRVGKDVDRVRMTLRSEEAVRDMHYALTHYLDSLDKLREKS